MMQHSYSPNPYPKSALDTAAAQSSCPVLSPVSLLCLLSLDFVSCLAATHSGSVDVQGFPVLSVSPHRLLRVCMWTRSSHTAPWRGRQRWTDGPRPTDRLRTDMESLGERKRHKVRQNDKLLLLVCCVDVFKAYHLLSGYCSCFEGSGACSKLDPGRSHTGRSPPGGGGACDVLSTVT